MIDKLALKEGLVERYEAKDHTITYAKMVIDGAILRCDSCLLSVELESLRRVAGRCRTGISIRNAAMNRIESKAKAYVNARKVHVSAYTVDEDGGAIVTVSGFVDGTQRWTVSVTPAGTECDCPFGEAHGITTQPHSHDTALRLAAWQIERINEQ